jgi:putative endonuclease
MHPMNAVHNYTVYILECSDLSFYTGITNDMERRLFEHQNGTNKDSYTFSKRPVKLVFTEHFDNPSDAIAFEKQIKGWRRSKKVALINRQWDQLPELSKRYSSDGPEV